MKDRIPTPIVDKNGKKTTVYRRAENAPPQTRARAMVKSAAYSELDPADLDYLNDRELVEWAEGQERDRVYRVVVENAYDWSHDPNVSFPQHVLNWFDDESIGHPYVAYGEMDDAIAYDVLNRSELVEMGTDRERQRIINEIKEKAYDWHRDRNASAAQNLLNWLDHPELDDDE